MFVNRRIKNNKEFVRMDSDSFINPYLQFWGLKLPLIFIEQTLIAHPEIDQCFVHISEESNNHPSIVIIIQKPKLDGQEKELIYDCSPTLRKEIKSLIKHEVLDIIEIDKVN